MTRENKYSIEISFDYKGQIVNYYEGNVPYYGSSSFKDKFLISSDKITIEAHRSGGIQLDSIFYNHLSSLYQQIIKSLLFYYATTKKFVRIKNVNISRTRSKNVLDKKVLKYGQFNQVLINAFKFPLNIQKDRLIELFNETPKGSAILIAISYMLKANSGHNESDKFEKLWKAFNKLYTHIGGSNLDFNCLRELREFTLNNPEITIKTKTKVHTLDTSRLRNSIRWRAMLLDNYNTEAKTGAFRDFILRYNDKRIMEILLETKYGYREEFLRKNGMFNEVDNHIQNCIAQEIINDNEIITMLTGKYMYFVRNKTFHGEKVDSTFRLSANKEDRELRFLNNILERYLVDLINANELY